MSKATELIVSINEFTNKKVTSDYMKLLADQIGFNYRGQGMLGGDDDRLFGDDIVLMLAKDVFDDYPGYKKDLKDITDIVSKMKLRGKGYRFYFSPEKNKSGDFVIPFVLIVEDPEKIDVKKLKIDIINLYNRFLLFSEDEMPDLYVADRRKKGGK